MAVDEARADALATDVVHTLKALTSMRQHMPRPADGVEHAAYPLLFTLATEPLRVSALAERVGSDVSTVSRQVSQLLASGLVAKTRDPDDRRAQLVELSDSGRALIESTRARRATYFQYLLRDWDVEDVDTFGELLGRFRESVLDVRAQMATDPQLMHDLTTKEKK